MKNVTNNKYLDDKKLINDVLERQYYSHFRNGDKKIEIFLNGICKANCDYCYLKKHQKSLFPLSIYNEDKIIENLRLLLNWYIENEFTCPIDIFSAEWLTTPLATRVFDCVYDVFSKVDISKRPPCIMAADNLQFLKNEQYTAMVEANIQKLNTLNIPFSISVSIDGKYCDYGRTECDDEYYNKLNDFMMKYNLRFHPMISADNVKYWIDNYVWFRNTFDPSLSTEIMTLEVRNEEWTDDHIQELIRYCDFLTDYKFEEFNQDRRAFFKYVFNIFETPDERREYPPYNVIGINHGGTFDNTDLFNCSVAHSLCIRVADLCISPCHRLYYPELKIGQYSIVDGKIDKVEPNNIELLIMESHVKRSCLPHCQNCKFQDMCVGFCQGASYEEYGNMLCPQIEVCRMYQAKFTFLIQKFYKLGLFTEDNLNILKRYYSNNKYSHTIDLIESIVGGITDEGQQ